MKTWFSPFGTEWEAETYEEAVEAERNALHAQNANLERAYRQACMNLATIRPDLSREDFSLGEQADLYYDALLAGWGGIEGYDPGRRQNSNQHSSFARLRHFIQAFTPGMKEFDPTLPFPTSEQALSDLRNLEEQLEAAERERDEAHANTNEGLQWLRDDIEVKAETIRRLEEQLEALQGILRGFLHDADNGDVPSNGLREKAREILNG